MAAIDFPASPFDGQTFAAPNGVIYVWSASKSLWLTSGIIAPLGADFSAVTNTPLTASIVTVVFGTVYSGNAGGYYNTSNGRFTPPAGRYRLTTWMSGRSNSNSMQINATIQKNGVTIPSADSVSSTPGANFNCTAIVDVIVDASGTDYFTVLGSASLTLNSNNCWFSAVPVAIPVQTPQMPNTLQLVSEQVLSVAASTLTVTFPANARRVEIDWAASSSSGGDVSLAFNVVQSGVVYSAANHNYQRLQGTGANATADFTSGQTGWAPTGPQDSEGQFILAPWLSNNGTTFNATAWSRTTAGVRQAHVWVGDCQAAFATVNGFRLAAGANLAAGSFLRAYVVP